MSLFHPSTEQIELATVLSVLGDQTRLSIVGYLARNEGFEINCSRFLDLGSKTNVSYHLAKLREAGITRTEVRGTNRLISLRRADLDQRFPGLLDSILASATGIAFDMHEAARAELRQLEREGAASPGPVG
ncbi:helix-turn-helix domain-containing protein [Mesorhizobium sp. LHD-90]|uniref:ArsR/SmtB family transcription factor n=1 Tax=Mesorhizobium sp. LHD-90 TaxID=3071414 RepID=UPI0027DED4B6|nr:helix-turn-helix domain-containing protein [Mesorhizobium sp. LHD-90]MDQ6436434.1 helix-turn-helix domain-containing protein [Mesorhizobium sp. LHD-90]